MLGEMRLRTLSPCAVVHMSSSTEFAHAAGMTCNWDQSCLHCPFSVPEVSCSRAIPSLTLFVVNHFKSSQQRQKIFQPSLLPTSPPDQAAAKAANGRRILIFSSPSGKKKLYRIIVIERELITTHAQ